MNNIQKLLYSSNLTLQPQIKKYYIKSTGTNCKTISYPQNTNFQIGTDTPKDRGGTNQYPQPIELLLSSFIGCEQATAQYVAKQLQVKIDKIDFNIEAERDENGAKYLPIEEDAPVFSRLQQIQGEAIVHGDIDEETIIKIGKIVEKRCPIANMIIQSGCILNVQWKKNK
ncbi:hypothetical protein IMG5_083570 [Ichthyophthirius multifiliis]|uniref:OsmC family protein n=1 Tax=Ichthyophthirius multifiliis TaxID=5932 RepID=G0QQT0_ICHMU|nr:hypothetical protein IMG5_083570 [Ichthyophthirius multifiliis]EGR32422.1 hypothetical protein IMG5_083570 [Ichthyophthirius multifiliis]|eukprot:XP_004036408.1 hypothetical protein IMG5_083570 [Ichthyophthirius multifiliis]